MKYVLLSIALIQFSALVYGQDSTTRKRGGIAGWIERENAKVDKKNGVVSNPCRFQKQVDKFSDEVNFSTPIDDKTARFARVHKNLTPLGPLYYLSLYASGSTLTVGRHPVTVLFENGKKFKSADDLDPSSAGYGWNYHVFIRIPPEQLSLFKESVITDYQLYIYDVALPRKHADRLQADFRCVEGVN